MQPKGEAMLMLFFVVCVAITFAIWVSNMADLAKQYNSFTECGACKKEVKKDEPFCRHCGEKLIPTCRQCKAEIRGDEKHCRQCGTARTTGAATAPE